MDIKLLEKLTNVAGISGHEEQVFNIMKDSADKLDVEVQRDNLGGFITKFGTKGPKILFAAHMDEVGFKVKRIDEDGFIYFQPVGGWYSQVLLAQKVVITNRFNKTFTGIIGSKPPHILPLEKRNEVVKIEDMYIDLGVKSKKQLEELNISIGDMITPDFKFSEMIDPDFMIAKAFDNRIGCFVMLEVMKKINTLTIENQTYLAATTQEEVGLRGAKTLGNKINPDIAIAVDTGIAGDTPHVSDNEANTKLGDGPLIVVIDATTIANPKLRYFITDICDELGIKYQLDLMPRGGTDAGSLHVAHDGALAITLSIATRYLHSHGSIVSKKDTQYLIDLIVNLITRINQKEYDNMKFS